jgi:ubiquinone/menaquinone biosynthesis C-methylase UbiE
VNENHQRVCPSPEWQEFLHEHVLPWLADRAEIGPELIEVGPGPGASTEWLRHRVSRLVAVELEPAAADKLRERFAGSNVEVLTADATDLPYDAASFDSAATFTMLHHVPTDELQDALLGELARVLRPGGTLIGNDSLETEEHREFHEGDIYNPVDPRGFGARLEAVGFVEVIVEPRDWKGMAFIARKPS